MLHFVTSSLFVLISVASQAPETDPKKCPAEERETFPAPAQLKSVEADLLALQTIQKKSLFPEISPEFREGLKDLFEKDPSKISKLEQFYGLLWLIGKNKKIEDRKIELDPAAVRKLLVSSRVFSDPIVPQHIQQATFWWSPRIEKVSYEVKFDQKEIRLPLNKGKGFANYREGLCQVAREVVFYGGFSFDVERKSNHNYLVTGFKDVDLFGSFGSRGVVSVDINYVTTKSVEFVKDTPMGVVRAKVAQREFDVNDHSWLLKMVSKLVTDKSTQPIDW